MQDKDKAEARHDLPNILIFMVDQMQHQVVMPEHPCHMPNARKLAEEGVMFTQTYTCSPHCCPSRATFMTGMYPSRHGVWNNVENKTAFRRGFRPGVRLFSEYIHKAGYELGIAGKWHVSSEETPSDRGWEEFSEFEKNKPLRGAKYWIARGDNPSKARGPCPRGSILRPGMFANPRSVYGPVLDEPDAYENAYYYKNAIKPGIKAVSELSQRGKPWAVYISTDMTHRTGVPRDIAELYNPEDVDLPPAFHDTLEDKPRAYQRLRRQLFDQLTEDEVRKGIAHYWAVCTLQDRYLGEILEALEATGQADNTLVLFISDHADFCYSHGFPELGIPSFREVYNIPAIVRWPKGIKDPGRVVNEFVSIADFAPTFIELACKEQTQDMTGRSLVPFLHGKAVDDWPDAVYTQSNGNEAYFLQRIVQTKKWKYVCNWFDFDELYDLENDPHEMVNLAFPDRVPQPSPNSGIECNMEDYTPWPRLAPGLESVRKELLMKMWRFAAKEDDMIFFEYPIPQLVSYGPMEAFGDKSSVAGSDTKLV